MMQDPTVLGYLGRALSLEMSAVQQYLALARLLEVRGMAKMGEKFRHEAREEMEHAERIIGRMLALGVGPSASQLRPASLEGTLDQLIQHVSQMELEIVGFYAQAVSYCERAQDHENRMFFAALLQEEQQHAGEMDALKQQIQAGETAGFE